ncbi:MAG: hypothetical protein IJC98_08375 [Clostridia bacterium]|nr:hypothetical protein [Clostridia bacterium]
MCMQEPLAAKYCDHLTQTVILCRDPQKSDEASDGVAQYRCLSSHLCGKETCAHTVREQHARR